MFIYLIVFHLTLTTYLRMILNLFISSTKMSLVRSFLISNLRCVFCILNVVLFWCALQRASCIRCCEARCLHAKCTFVTSIILAVLASFCTGFFPFVHHTENRFDNLNAPE